MNFRSSPGNQQELELSYPGAVGDAGVGPTTAWAVSYLCLQTFPGTEGSALSVHSVDGGWQPMETEHVTGHEGYKVCTLFSDFGVGER